MIRANSLFARLLAHRLAAVSSAVLAALLIYSFSTPVLELWLNTDGSTVDLFSRLLPFSQQHPLGTDELGRDLLIRLAYGGQVSLIVALAAAVISSAVGTVIGLLSGYFGGWLDSLLMRLTDSVIALPLLPLLIILAAIDLQKLGLPAELAQSESISFYRIIIIVSLVGWTGVARLVRSTALALREQPYVKAAKALGASPVRIIFTHLLPGLSSPIIVATTLSVGNLILFESILSFLGLGVHPPAASWGNMLTNAQELIWESPILAVLPGFMIFVTVISFNFIGDGLQDALAMRSSAISRRK